MDWLDSANNIITLLAAIAVGVPAVYALLGKLGYGGKILWSIWLTIKDGQASDNEIAYHFWQLVAVLGGWSPKAGSQLLRFAPDAQIKALKDSGFLAADYVIKKKV